MKRKKAALYDPYLDTMGGGEKHVLSIMQVLAQNGYDVTIFWDENLSAQIESKINVRFDRKLSFRPSLNRDGAIAKMKALKDFDVFIYVTDGSYFYATADQNYVFCMVPNRALYRMTPLNRMKTMNATFISNSRFTQHHMQSWGVTSELLYPYIDTAYFRIPPATRRKDVILSVGRFFGHLHSKRHDETIAAFRRLHNHKKFSHFKLVLAGGLKPEDQSYYDHLKSLVADDSSIELRPNISYPELRELYASSLVYWHFAGYGVNVETEPQNVEHLGITPLEAMAAGCITYAYNAGGPAEIIDDGADGFLFSSTDELITKMSHVVGNADNVAEIRSAARKMVKSIFSYDVFETNVKHLFNL